MSTSKTRLRPHLEEFRREQRIPWLPVRRPSAKATVQLDLDADAPGERTPSYEGSWKSEGIRGAPFLGPRCQSASREA